MLLYAFRTIIQSSLRPLHLLKTFKMHYLRKSLHYSFSSIFIECLPSMHHRPGHSEDKSGQDYVPSVRSMKMEEDVK